MASFPETPDNGESSRFAQWINERLPVASFWKAHVSEYYAPKNFNFWYYFGSLALLILVNQLITGIFLTMSYKPSDIEAFGSVEYIMRDVEWGWLIRYLHSTGASAFFIVVYLHMFRSLMYGSHRKPRELLPAPAGIARIPVTRWPRHSTAPSRRRTRSQVTGSSAIGRPLRSWRSIGPPPSSTVASPSPSPTRMSFAA